MSEDNANRATGSEPPTPVDQPKFEQPPMPEPVKPPDSPLPPEGYEPPTDIATHGDGPPPVNSLAAYTSVSDCRYGNSDRTVIIAKVDFAHLPSSVEFAARADDVSIYGPEIFRKAKAGQFGPIAAFVEPPQPVPPEVSLGQFRVAVRRAGHFVGIDQAAKVSADPMVVEGWEYGSVVSRSGALAGLLKTVAGMSDAQVDGLFREAVTIRL